MGVALEAPAWPPIALDEAAAIVARFPGAGRALSLLWHSPRPFSAAALIATDRGSFLLKRHHRRVRTPAGLTCEHDFIGHLRARGMPVPEILATADGEGALAHGEWTYELQRAAPGTDLYRDRPSWTPFFMSDHARAAGAALANLHLAAQGFTRPARPDAPLVASLTILPATDPLAAAETFVAARPALAAFLAVRPWRRELSRLLAVLGDGLSTRLVRCPSLWTHNDWHPSNLLWTPGGAVETIFDFGLATRTKAHHDVATAIERTAFDWLRLGEGTMAVDTDAVAALLNGYHSIIPLTAGDVETIARLLPLVHLEFALSEIDYFKGITGNRGDALLAWDGYLIGHAEWFLSPAGTDFRAWLDGFRPR